jgi:hypothetical protein
MRTRLITITAAAAGLALSPAAQAHFVAVTPPGTGDEHRVHVGQAAAAGHTSCAGHLQAAQSEQSGAVRFIGPASCPPR